MDELTCLSIHPGSVNTDMVNNVIQNSPSELEIVKMYKQMIEKKELISPQLAAENIHRFLFSDSDMRENAHGKLYLADKGEIFKPK
jgi:NAD(P)-dependent dehydrogenase (short-subunit alcohol dehydrogenase family)